jgi:D-glycero-D-manno-heptose 1,7-bisphosphate phosphatase
VKPRAVFLDRDGVLIRDAEYLDDPAGLRLIPGAPEAMRLLRAAGFKLVVVTNQSGVARGFYSIATLNRIHARLKRMLAAKGAGWDALYFSPHGPDSGSPMRKPKPGMLLAAKRRFGLDMKGSWMIGDKTSDVECARRAGCRSVLVRTGKGGRDRAYKAKPHAAKKDVLAAAGWILAHSE